MSRVPFGTLQLAANSRPQSTKETRRVIFIDEGQDTVRDRVQAVKAIAQSKVSAIVKTRLKLSGLSVPCILSVNLISLSLPGDYRHMPTPSRKSKSSDAHLLFD